MKCRQCSNPIKVKFGGAFCSSSCMDFKPRPKKNIKAVTLEGVIYVDASVSEEEIAPLHLKPHSLSRAELIKEFKELRNE